MANRNTLVLFLAAFLLLGGATASASTYYIWDDWGGTWSDAEKASDNSDDDLLCWAASSSNILEWTGWGLVSGMTNTDQMFSHFQAHFTDDGGNPYYGWDWWFDGTNDVQGSPGWAQEDVDGGGAFYLTENINDYRRFSSVDSAALSNLDAWMKDGYGTTISIAGNMAHSITCWGFEMNDQGAYTAIYVTDSDDDKGGPGNATRPNVLQKYGVTYTSGAWYLSGGYYGTGSTNYISEVVALKKRQTGPVVPLPSAGLMGLGLMGMLLTVRRIRRKR